jgi:uncharacterized phiE125 gp8 family phage protein
LHDIQDERERRMVVGEQEPGAQAVPLAAVKAYLRIGTCDDDALLDGLIRGAAALCEQFLGQWLIIREARETVASGGEWRRLEARPVRAILSVVGVDAAGAEVALPVESHAVDIDASGDGWVRVSAVPSGVTRVVVRYLAGIGETGADLPEALRQGVIRLAAEQYLRRGDGAVEQPPAVVTALWRPWRRMRLA